MVSGSKKMLAKRMKQSAMTWSLAGTKDTFDIRASVMSRRFWDDFERLLPSSPPQEPTRPTWRLLDATTLRECTPGFRMIGTQLECITLGGMTLTDDPRGQRTTCVAGSATTAGVAGAAAQDAKADE